MSDANLERSEYPTNQSDKGLHCLPRQFFQKSHVQLTFATSQAFELKYFFKKSFWNQATWNLLNGWMDDLQFYVLFKSVWVISRQWAGNTGKLCAMEPCLWLIRSQAGLEPGTARSVGQHLTYWATRATTWNILKLHLIELIIFFISFREKVYDLAKQATL